MVTFHMSIQLLSDKVNEWNQYLTAIESKVPLFCRSLGRRIFFFPVEGKIFNRIISEILITTDAYTFD